MQTFIIDNGSHYLEQLVSLLSNYSPRVISFGELVIETIPDDSFVVLSGGHTIPVLWHDNDFAKEIEIIKNHKGPILGVCLGAQLIAHVYGSHLHLLDERRKGLTKITTTRDIDILGNDEYDVYESHNWSIKHLGNSLIALAESDDGIEIFKHKTKPMYGVQFHPESEEDVTGKVLYERVLLGLDV